MNIHQILKLKKDERRDLLKNLGKKQLQSLNFNKEIQELYERKLDLEDQITQIISPESIQEDGLLRTDISIREPIRISNLNELSLNITVVDNSGYDRDSGYFWSKEIASISVDIDDINQSPENNRTSSSYGSGGERSGLVKIKTKDGDTLKDVRAEDTLLLKGKAMIIAAETANRLKDPRIREELKYIIQELNNTYLGIFKYQEAERDIQNEIQEKIKSKIEQSLSVIGMPTTEATMTRVVDILSEQARRSDDLGQASTLIYHLSVFERQDGQMAAHFSPIVVSATKLQDGRILFSTSKSNLPLHRLLETINDYQEGYRISKADLISENNNKYHIPNDKARFIARFLQNKSKEQGIHIEKVILTEDDIELLKRELTNKETPKPN